MRVKALSEWIFNVVVLIFATSTVAQPFVIPSASMENTLMTGDHVLVDKLAYAPFGSWTAKLFPYEQVSRGDIVIFRYPPDPRQTYVKRVIGLPGDRIRLEKKSLWRNGIRLHEPYVHHLQSDDTYRDNFPRGPQNGVVPLGARMLDCCVHDDELIVPAGNYFVLGDNRDNSLDSRYWGFVPRANVIGKPVLVWWSYEASEEELTDFVSLPHMLDLATHFFTKTRWNRTMRVIRN